MEMMKKLAILMIIACNFNIHADTFKKISKSANKTFSKKNMNKITINPGETSAPCKSSSDCHSGHCYAGLCSQYTTKTNNEIVEGTALGVAALPMVATGAVGGAVAGEAVGGDTGLIIGGAAGAGAEGYGIDQMSKGIANQ